ncbi:DUF6597 domain-containing transcriptional factor [Brevibacillus sp. B_LB10_24]|uniref:AraC family transcriptional regulator n=1 Tax=Brevibacillus sp. B_LB10_24 TaxID=3380645 RepID=UPI0038B86303
MLQRTYIPHAPLSRFVDQFWYLRGYKPSHTKEKALPDGSVEVVINLREDAIRLFDRVSRELIMGSSVVCGPHTDFFVIDTSYEMEVIGIHFKPGGFFPFLKMPLDEILNSHVPLHALWGSAASDLRDELLASRGPEEMFPILEHRLLSLACRELERNRAVDYAISHLRRFDVTNVIEQIGMSHRRFNQVFKQATGMTPKRLSRLYRFQEALHLMDQGLHGPDLALACGYCDQSHFIKDFQSFSGITPGTYLPIEGRHYNHSVHRT